MNTTQLRALVTDNFEKHDSPLPEPPCDCDRCEMDRALLLLLDVADAAQSYRDKVDYTGGDSVEQFAEQQTILDCNLARFRTAFPKE